MSRSRRKRPFTGVTVKKSEKQDKQLWHRAFRRVSRAKMAQGDEPLLHPEQVKRGDLWAMDKDGKMRLPDPKGKDKKYMRK